MRDEYCDFGLEVGVKFFFFLFFLGRFVFLLVRFSYDYLLVFLFIKFEIRVFSEIVRILFKFFLLKGIFVLVILFN